MRTPRLATCTPHLATCTPCLATCTPRLATCTPCRETAKEHCGAGTEGGVGWGPIPVLTQVR